MRAIDADSQSAIGSVSWLLSPSFSSGVVFPKVLGRPADCKEERPPSACGMSSWPQVAHGVHCNGSRSFWTAFCHVAALWQGLQGPLCDIPSGCDFFTGPWTVPRSSLRMWRRVAAFCRPLRPVLLLVSFLHSRSPVVGVLGLCWMWRDWGWDAVHLARSAPRSFAPRTALLAWSLGNGIRTAEWPIGQRCEGLYAGRNVATSGHRTLLSKRKARHQRGGGSGCRRPVCRVGSGCGSGGNGGRGALRARQSKRWHSARTPGGIAAQRATCAMPVSGSAGGARTGGGNPRGRVRGKGCGSTLYGGVPCVHRVGSHPKGLCVSVPILAYLSDISLWTSPVCPSTHSRPWHLARMDVITPPLPPLPPLPQPEPTRHTGLLHPDPPPR